MRYQGYIVGSSQALRVGYMQWGWYRREPPRCLSRSFHGLSGAGARVCSGLDGPEGRGESRRQDGNEEALADLAAIFHAWLGSADIW